MTDLTLDLVQSQLKPQQKLLIDEGTIQEIQKLAEDPDYGEEFLDTYLDHLNILKENPRRNHRQYLNAVKFFSLVEAQNTLTDAYIKTFPERFTERTKDKPRLPDGTVDKSIMRGEASRYNSSMMVTEIRRIAAIPVQLIHRHLLHEAILDQADLMRTARSEMVRQRAGATLITELKPQEDHQINLNVDDGSISVIAELQKAAQALAASQHEAVMAGVPIKQIAGARIFANDEEVIEGEVIND